MTITHQNSRSPFLQYGYPVLCILSGLIVAQVIATFQVYVSNIELQASLKIIKNAGYLAIPNQTIINRLQEFGPAFYGGLFFTLSIGAGLSLPAFGASWIWVRIFSSKTSILLLLLIPWLLSLVLVNRHGFSPFVSAYFLFIPVTVFRMTRKLMPSLLPGQFRAFKIIHPGLFIILGFLWAWQMGGNVFMDVRDNLLLSSSLGGKLNAFYYRYTFYPAQVFKPLNRKGLKTCLITQVGDSDLKEALERELLQHDYLPLEKTGQMDLILSKKGEEILLQHGGKTVMTTTAPRFLATGPICLKEFSQKMDRHVFFRKCVFLSLLTGLPAALYLFLFVLIRSFAALFFKTNVSGVIASFICFGMGIALLTPIISGNQKKTEGKSLNEMLESDKRQERITAFNKMLAKRLEISDYPAYEKLLRSPHVPDRYWLTKTMAFSQNPETLKDLLAFLNDASPNVVSMAYWALGLRGDKSTLPEILKRIPISDDWYNQWYAYNALKDLGWTQAKPYKISHRPARTNADKKIQE